MRHLNAGAALVFGALAGMPALAAPPCLPPGYVSLSAHPDGRNLRPIQVYIDGSGSMAGFAAGATSDVRPMGDLIDTVRRTAQNGHAPVQFFAFGSKIAPIPRGSEGASRYATTAAYNCKGCDNKESHIDAVLRQAAAGDPSNLYVIVTDLWLDNKQFTGSSQVALGGPLTDMLRQGRAVGVLGVRAPFRGKITDFPTPGVYADASEHPLFVLLIGPAGQVQAMRDALAHAGSPAFQPERTRYSLFVTRPGNIEVSAQLLSSAGGGAARSVSILPEYMQGQQQFKLRLDEAKSRNGRIEGVVDAGAGVRDNSVWSGELKASTRVWRLQDEGALRGCARSAWTEVAPLQGAWRAEGGHQARLTLSPQTAASLAPGHAYYVAGYLGVRKLETPNPADNWMREWSFSAAQEQALRKRRPRFFPTLNLADLASSMEAALDRAAPNGTDTAEVGFVVRIDH